MGTFCFSLTMNITHAFSPFFKDVAQNEIPYYVGTRTILPKESRYLRVDFEEIKTYLNNAPSENSGSYLPLDIPMPDGTTAKFLIQQYNMMEPGLASKFPGIKTFLGKGVTDVYANIRLDYTYQGFHATIISPIYGTFSIDPYANQSQEYYISYFKKDLENIHNFSCHTQGEEDNALTGSDKDFLPNGTELRTYRTAVAATGEYTAYHGGTVAGGQSAIVSTINRVNQVYEVDLSVRLTLIANNDVLVYTNATTDPFSNNNAGQLITQSQNTINSVIGSANYDVGHTVSTGGGGLASLGVVCASSSKASGITGSPAPTGDPFWIDYVAHEFGHQFNSNHTFTANTGSCTGNRSSQNAYEPGGGSTVMAYAGICGSNDNVQNNSDPYFHTRSYERIRFHITGSANVCAARTNTNNTIPTVDAGNGGLTAPISTPFKLTAVASDEDGDNITYCWEQYDLGNSAISMNTTPTAAMGTVPLFRSYSPDISATRYFPRLQNVISGINNNREKLPTLTREMNFRVTVRDNKVNGGAAIIDSVKYFFTATAGPFIVTSPTLLTDIWTAGTAQTVTWDVSNTNVSPVNCSKVNIRLSLDGGFTYPILLAGNVDNDGSHSVYVPASNATETSARVMVESVGNIFYNISGRNFTILPGGNVSVKEELTTQISVFPNPASEYTTIAIDQNVSLTNATYQLTNILGQTLITKNITDYNTSVSLEGLASGMYMIRIVANNQSSTHSIIVR